MRYFNAIFTFNLQDLKPSLHKTTLEILQAHNEEFEAEEDAVI